MKHLSYFVALVAAGSVVLALALGSFVMIPAQLLAFAFGVPPDSETVKVVVNSSIALIWLLVLIGYWIRDKGLSPRLVKTGHGSKLARGHLCLIAGHVLVLCIYFVKAFGFLMILPVLGVLFFYGAGIALIEIARDRRGPEPLGA